VLRLTGREFTSGPRAAAGYAKTNSWADIATRFCV